MAEFVCPACDHRQSVPDAHAGKVARCPKCHKSSVVQIVRLLTVPDCTPEVGSESVLVLRANGGSIQTLLSRSIRLNKESTLEREFISIVHRDLPAGLTSCVGVTTVYEPETDYSSGQYVYASRFAIKAIEGIRAFEVRFLLFNIWGRHVSTLSATEIADVSAGVVRPCESKWLLFSENEACEHYASIAYLATIRTFDGQVFEADHEPVLEEARRFSAKFADSDLEPTPTKTR